VSTAINKHIYQHLMKPADSGTLLAI